MSTSTVLRARLSPHLRRLEAESIGILREVAAEFHNPVMLYSIGKDSGVMLHLALKAFYPSKPPFPLLHIDTGWKFRDMIRHRDQIVKHYGVRLLVHTNPEGLARGINPLSSGSRLHTQVMKTEALKQRHQGVHSPARRVHRQYRTDPARAARTRGGLLAGRRNALRR